MLIGIRTSRLGHRYQCSCGQHGGLVKSNDGFALVDGGGWRKLLDAIIIARTHNETVHHNQAEYDLYSFPVGSV